MDIIPLGVLEIEEQCSRAGCTEHAEMVYPVVTEDNVEGHWYCVEHAELLAATAPADFDHAAALTDHADVHSRSWRLCVWGARNNHHRWRQPGPRRDA